MSQVLFVKSGGYYETPAIAVAQAIYEATADEVKQFIKIDMSFKFDFVEGEHRVYMANHIPGASLLYRKIDFKRLITGIEKYGFAYYGCVVDAIYLLGFSNFRHTSLSTHILHFGLLGICLPPLLLRFFQNI